MHRFMSKFKLFFLPPPLQLQKVTDLYKMHQIQSNSVVFCGIFVVFVDKEKT